MTELSQMDRAERVFLAGCIRAVMLADGNIQEAELDDLDKIYKRLGFHDYEECLDEFEKKAPDETGFMAEAAAVRNPAAQDLILKTIYELTVQNGPPEHAEQAIFMKLSRLWERRGAPGKEASPASSAGKNLVPRKLLDVVGHEGVVAILTHGAKEAHLVNTWNSYLTITGGGRILYPAGGMKTTERNLGKDRRVQMTLGSREVEGLHGRGAGFLIRGTGAFLTSGPDFASVKERFPWARAAVEISIESVTQTL
jgi:hypothetical protein